MKRTSTRVFAFLLRGFVVVVFGAATFGVGGSAAAHYGCQGSINNYFTGRQNFTNDVYGASAEAVYRPGSICIGAPVGEFVTGWSMITPTNNDQVWAQSGYMQRRHPEGDHFTHFWQIKKCSNVCSHETTWGAFVQSGEVHQVWQERKNTACGSCIRSNIDSLTVYEFLPGTGWGRPWRSVYSGETLHIGSDMPGLPGTDAIFRKLQRQTSSLSWTGENSSALQNNRPLNACPQRFGLSNVVILGDGLPAFSINTHNLTGPC